MQGSFEPIPKLGDREYAESPGKQEILEDSGIVISILDDIIPCIYIGISDIQDKPIEWLCWGATLIPENVVAIGLQSILLE